MMKSKSIKNLNAAIWILSITSVIFAILWWLYLLISESFLCAHPWFGSLREFVLCLLSASLSALVALLIVNYWLDGNRQKRMASALIRWIRDPVANFHNYVTQQGFDALGSSNWNSMVNDYGEANGDPNRLGDKLLDFFYSIAKGDAAEEFTNKCKRLGEKLTAVLIAAGPNLEPEVFNDTLEAVTALSKLLELLENDDKKKIAEHMLDAYIHNYALWTTLTDCVK